MSVEEEIVTLTCERGKILWVKNQGGLTDIWFNITRDSLSIMLPLIRDCLLHAESGSSVMFVG